MTNLTDGAADWNDIQTEILTNLRADLSANVDLQAKTAEQRFFKEDIKMYGMKTAVANQIGKKYLVQLKTAKLSKAQIFDLCENLWASGYQEEAIIACIFSESQKAAYTEADFPTFATWLQSYVSNWAKCDTLCNHTVGDLLMLYPHLADNLLTWTSSENRWVKRGAAVSLIVPARKGLFLPLIWQIADALLLDGDDMVQKGYGWMLKAAAEAHEAEVFSFVLDRKSDMPRTALRYAIEKMPPDLKKQAMAR